MELQTNIENQDWYKALLDDCEAIIVETEFQARWALVEGYHLLGRRIIEEQSKFEESGYGKRIVQCIGESLGKSENTIYYAIQFAKKFPDINSLPEGKNTSWYKICNELLPDKKESGQKANRTKKHAIFAISINDLFQLNIDATQVSDELMKEIVTKVQAEADFTSIWEAIKKEATKLVVEEMARKLNKPTQNNELTT